MYHRNKVSVVLFIICILMGLFILFYEQKPIDDIIPKIDEEIEKVDDKIEKIDSVLVDEIQKRDSIVEEKQKIKDKEKIKKDEIKNYNDSTHVRFFIEYTTKFDSTRDSI